MYDFPHIVARWCIEHEINPIEDNALFLFRCSFTDLLKISIDFNLSNISAQYDDALSAYSKVIVNYKIRHTEKLMFNQYFNLIKRKRRYGNFVP